jgi:purine-cytosine permease-like protein
VYFVLGVLAVLTIAGAGEAFTPTDFVPALLALPAGAVALVVLLVDEVDEAFANVYSTAMSTQNLVPRWDRRVIAVVVGVLATALALLVDLVAYESFLFLIGAVFVPLMVMLVVDWFVVRRLVGGEAGAGWSVTDPGPGRWLMLLPWAAGFAAYNLVNPGLVEGWAAVWTSWRESLGFVPPTWLSASLLSAAVAAVLTLAVGIPLARRAAAR